MNEVVCGCGENHGLTPIKPGDYDYRCFCGVEWKLIIRDEPPYPPLPAQGPSAQEQIEVLTKRVEALERRLAELLEGEK